jgi:hypothetical protein
MIKILQVLTFLVLGFNFAYSQNIENETDKLSSFKTIKKTSCQSYGNWSKTYELENGLIVSQRNYSGNTLTLIQKNIYNHNKNVIYEISIYNRNSGYKIDTTLSYSYKYDEKNRIIEKKYSFGMIEKYSAFDKNSKPKLIERLNENGKPLYFFPITENMEYDSIGNLIKETKTELEYASDNDTTKQYKVEINTYKYDRFGNVIQLKREFSPKEEFPIIMTGGLPLYETEEFEYKYNEKGLWKKKYWIVQGKKRLLEKREFKL